MSSSCYFQFKSQKEPTRVTFDGTGISVFELKREIINISKLGDGTDFDLSMYNKDTNEGESPATCSRLRNMLTQLYQNTTMILPLYLAPLLSSLDVSRHRSQAKAERLAMSLVVCQLQLRMPIVLKPLP